MVASFLKQFDKYNDKYGVWVFYLGLFLMIVSRYWYSFNQETPKDVLSLYLVLRHAGKLLIVFRILLFAHRYPIYVLCCIIAIITIWISHCLSGWGVLLSSFIIIAASRDTDIKIILKIFLVSFLIILVIAPTSLIIGWTGDVVKHKINMVGHSWGVSNPNTLAFLLLMLALLILNYWNIKKTKVIWIICWSTALLICIITLSLTSAVILLLIPILYHFLNRYPIPTWSLILFPWVCLLTSIILSYYYGPSYGETTFESRFSIPALVYQNHGLSLFGQDYGYVSFQKAWRTGVHPLCVDNAFMHLVLCDGLVIALFVFVFLSHYLYKLGNMRHPLLVSSAVGLILSGLMENIALDAMSNFLLLYYFFQYTPPSKPVQEELRS